MNKKYRIVICSLALAVVLSLSLTVAVIIGGADEDSVIRLVSYDYIENYLLGYINGRDDESAQRINQLEAELAALRAQLDSIGSSVSSDNKYEVKDIAKGTSVVIKQGSTFILTVGSAALSSGQLINVTSGEASSEGGTVLVNNQYVAGTDITIIASMESDCTILIKGEI